MNGELLTGVALEQYILRLHMGLFTSQGHEDNEIDVNFVFPKVNEEMNAILMQPDDCAKIYQAIKQMHPIKAQSSNRFPRHFFLSQVWFVFGEDMFALVM